MSSWIIYAIIVSAASVGIHIASKLAYGEIDPLLFSAVAGSIFFIITTVMFFWLRGPSFAVDIPMKVWGIAAAGGLMIAATNIAVVFMYKSGAPISIAVPLTRTISTLLAICIGLTIFTETLTAVKAFGIVLSIVAVVLMSL